MVYEDTFYEDIFIKKKIHNQEKKIKKVNFLKMEKK